MTMEITVNGDPRQLPENSTLDGLIRNLGLSPATVAALVNDEIVEREHFETTQLSARDTVELVRFVPGG